MMLLVVVLDDFKRDIFGELRLAVKSFQDVQLIISSRLSLRSLLE
jgi:hypothetical protein